MTTIYGWIIDIDHVPTDGAEAQSSGNATNMFGPKDIDNELLNMLKKGDGRKFDILDCDEVLYYTGRLLVLNNGKDMIGTELDFAPLDDFGAPNAGCTTIAYNGVKL